MKERIVSSLNIVYNNNYDQWHTFNFSLPEGGEKLRLHRITRFYIHRLFFLN